MASEWTVRVASVTFQGRLCGQNQLKIVIDAKSVLFVISDDQTESFRRSAVAIKPSMNNPTVKQMCSDGIKVVFSSDRVTQDIVLEMEAALKSVKQNSDSKAPPAKSKAANTQHANSIRDANVETNRPSKRPPQGNAHQAQRVRVVTSPPPKSHQKTASASSLNPFHSHSLKIEHNIDNSISPSDDTPLTSVDSFQEKAKSTPSLSLFRSPGSKKIAKSLFGSSPLKYSLSSASTTFSKPSENNSESYRRHSVDTHRNSDSCGEDAKSSEVDFDEYSPHLDGYEKANEISEPSITKANTAMTNLFMNTLFRYSKSSTDASVPKHTFGNLNYNSDNVYSRADDDNDNNQDAFNSPLRPSISNQNHGKPAVYSIANDFKTNKLDPLGVEPLLKSSISSFLKRTAVNSTLLKFKGIANIGNSCYMNAVVQAIINIPIVHKSLVSLDDNVKNNVVTVSAHAYCESPTVEALKKLTKLNHEPNHGVLDIISLKNAVDAHCGTRQHDAQEFLSALIDIISDELKSEAEKGTIMSPKLQNCDGSDTPSAPISSAYDLEKISSMTAKKRLLYDDEDTHQLEILRFKRQKLGESQTKEENYIPPVYSLFHSVVGNKITCSSCGKSRFKEESYIDFSLELYNSNNCGISTLDNLLNKFFSEEERELSCEFCKVSNATAKFSSCVLSPPKVLIIHLKRFQFNRETYTLQKSRMPVEFPKTLNMKRYLNHECMQVPDYDLVSIVRHHGETVEAGHYICDRASNNVETSEQGYDCKSWQRCNDSVVTDISEAQVLAEKDTPYILFYSCRNN